MGDLKFVFDAVTAVGIVFLILSIGYQAHLMRVSADFNSLAQFNKDWLSHNEALRTASGDSITTHFYYLLAFLETYCAAYNVRIINDAASRTIRDSLIDMLVLIHCKSEARTLMEAARTSKTTFREIDRFTKRHRRSIDRAIAASKKDAV